MTNLTAPMMLYSLAGGLSIGGIAYTLVRFVQAGHEEALRSRAMGRQASSPLFKLIRPIARWLAFFFGGMLAKVEMGFGKKAEDSWLAPARIWAEKRLRAAAHPEGVTADEFLGMMLMGCVAFGLFGYLVHTIINFKPVIVFFGLTGIYLPILWLRNRLHQRQTEIRRHLPYALDMLTLSVEAGLDFTQALARIVAKLSQGALAEELGQMTRDIQLGKTRSQALRELGLRVEVAELNSIVSALIQADELGSSLGPILRVQADQLRERRSQRAEKQAMEAPVKILLPLIFFIFPTIIIMIFGPMVLSLIK